VPPIIQPPTEELTAMVLRSNTKSNRETTNNRLTNLSRPPRRSLRLDNKRAIFAGSGSSDNEYYENDTDQWSQPDDNDHDHPDSLHVSSGVLREVYQHALGGHSYNDTLSHSMKLGLSREQALYHAEMAQEIYHTAQDKVDKESKEQADKAAEVLRLESEATHRNARMQEKCVQAAKASVAPMIQREVENRLQQRASQDLSEYEQDGRSYNDLSFINSGRISSNEPNYQPYNQPYNPFDFDYSQPYNQTGVPAIINSNPVMINSATMHKPQQHNNHQGHNNQMRPRTQSPHHQSANHPPYRSLASSFTSDNCPTCGQTKADCESTGPKIVDDFTKTEYCYLRDHPLACRVDLNINALDQLKLAALSPEKLDRVLHAAHRNGCLRGHPLPVVEELRAKIPTYKEYIGQSLVTKPT
jgi:hypothetical protein